MKTLNVAKSLVAFVALLLPMQGMTQTRGPWLYVTTDSKMAYSFRTDRITPAINPQARKVWVRYDALKEAVLLNANNPKSKRFSYAVVQWIVNCKADQFSTGSQNYYDSNGNVIYSDEGHEFMTSTVVPETVGDAIVSSFCIHIGERK